MSEIPQPAKRRNQPRKPPAARTEGSAEKEGGEPRTSDIGADARPDEALQTDIARRAYEISQSDTAQNDEANWLRAERELRGA
jgi:hypothetical protein